MPHRTRISDQSHPSYNSADLHPDCNPLDTQRLGGMWLPLAPQIRQRLEHAVTTGPCTYASAHDTQRIASILRTKIYAAPHPFVPAAIVGPATSHLNPASEEGEAGHGETCPGRRRAGAAPHRSPRGKMQAVVTGGRLPGQTMPPAPVGLMSCRPRPARTPTAARPWLRSGACCRAALLALAPAQYAVGQSVRHPRPAAARAPPPHVRRILVEGSRWPA